MADIRNVNEVLESVKRKLQDDYDRQIYEDLYRKSEAATAATKKLLDELKKDAQSISELNIWKDIENMREAYQYEEEENFLCENIVPIESSDNSWWIASENVLPEVLPETKEKKKSGVKYIFTTRPYSEIAHIHQRDKPIWLDVDLKKEIVLGEPDEEERQAMELEEKKMALRYGPGKETITSNLFNNGKNRKQKDEETKNKRRTEIYNMLNYGTKKRQTEEENKTKRKQTKGEPITKKKHTVQSIIDTLCSCFRKTKPEEAL
ncbi:uncharacterized protein LOC134705910 [Mytilus trossulus]|uniref:uncharacterized protein LOC134705910 n=1 Tax=Mytilus trossulus TaxID=6551 RepID=UPI0030053D31